MGKKTCIDCGKTLTGHGYHPRCLPCAARHRYIAKYGKPAEMFTGKCEVCGKLMHDYASNKRKGKVHLCSLACRAAWTGVANSINRGGDAIRRTKQEKDRIDYVKHAPRRRQKMRSYYHANRKGILSKKQIADRALKAEVIAAYGGKCECCGEAHIEFMTIDHINGDGAAHRARCGKGRKVYADIKRQGFPKDKYRCLCLNCNIALGFYGYCPHNPNKKRNVDHRPKKPGRRRTVA